MHRHTPLRSLLGLLVLFTLTSPPRVAVAYELPNYNIEWTCTFATLQANGGDPEVLRRYCIQSEQEALEHMKSQWRLAPDAQQQRVIDEVSQFYFLRPGGSYRILERAIRAEVDRQ